MAISPWYVGMTAPALQISLNTDSGQDNISNLVPGNFTLVLRNTGLGSDTNGTGTFAIISTNPAIVTYTFSSADVATAGSYQLIVKGVFNTGTKIWDPLSFTITAI